MSIGVSLLGDAVSIRGNVSLTPTTTALFAVEVSLFGGVSLTGNSTGVIPPPPGQGPMYDFSKASNSYYITTTAFG